MFWILLFIALVFFTYFILIKPFYYWQDRGVPQHQVWITWKEIFFGFIPNRSLVESVRKAYNDFPNKRYYGLYQFIKPALILKDPNLIKQIAVKDFDHFTDHYQALPENSEPLWEKNLFSLKGEKWREMRSILSPSFTSSKMKIMFGLISDCAKQFVDYFQEKDVNVVPVEMKDIFTRFTNDVIASVAFGLECNSLKEPENEFYLMGNKVTDFTGFVTGIRTMIILLMPTLSKFIGLKFFNTKALKFFSKIIKHNLETREKNSITRYDMIHLLMEARKNNMTEKQEEMLDDKITIIGQESEKLQTDKLTDQDITAQALIFFFAGFDSVSTLMSFMAYELAVNPDVQQKLQKEIDETLDKSNQVITYEALMKMTYLDMVVSETLRKWPGGIVVDRACIKPYIIEPTKPGEIPVHLKKGDVVWLPIFGFHRDPKYYPNPERFDPERFNEENKSGINPYAFMAFGVGPRSCIGNRFALMETKLVFTHILSKFDIIVTNQTQVPLKLAKSQLQMKAERGIWLGFQQREM